MSQSKAMKNYLAKRKAIDVDLELDETEDSEQEMEIPKEMVTKAAKAKRIPKLPKASTSVDNFNDEFEIIMDNAEEEDAPISNKIKLGNFLMN